MVHFTNEVLIMMLNLSVLCNFFIYAVRFICMSYDCVIKSATIYMCENNGADQLRGNHEADQRFCFRYTDNTLFFLNTIFQTYIDFLSLHSPVCVEPGRKPKLLVLSRGGSLSLLIITWYCIHTNRRRTGGHNAILS